MHWLQTLLGDRRHHMLFDRAPEAGAKLLLTLAAYLVGRWALGRLLRAVMTQFVARTSQSRGEGQAARLRTLHGILQSSLNYLLLFVAIVAGLDAVGLNIGALLAGAGVAGMAVGFGAQRLVRDVITGFFILIEDQYAVGDCVTISGTTGEVTEIGMRITKIRDEAGRLVILANGDISTVVNHSRGPLVATVEVSVPRETDLGALQDRLDEMEMEPGTCPLLERPRVRGIAALDTVRITLRVTAPARPGEQQEAEMLLRQKIKEAIPPQPAP